MHNFCSVDLGGFYLDVIKDRQYTTQPDSVARRSAQTAMYHIIEAMTRWIAPVLSFTADEVWENLPGAHEALGAFTAEWYEGLFTYQNTEINYEVWESLEQVRTEVTRALEGLRKNGKIGAGLDAEVTIYADQKLLDQFRAISEELRFVLITSEVKLALLQDTNSAQAIKLANGTIAIEASPSEHAKCVRCWHHRAEVGQNDSHPQLCGRCIDNIDGDGEKRLYA